MSFDAGQMVVWLRHPQNQPRKVFLVDAVIVQIGPIRTRIRVRTATGKALLRWVHPRNLRAKASNEPEYMYPGQIQPSR